MSPTPSKKRKLTHAATPNTRSSQNDEQDGEQQISTSAKRSSARRRVPSTKAVEAEVSSPKSTSKRTGTRGARTANGLATETNTTIDLNGKSRTSRKQSQHRESPRRARSPISLSTPRSKALPSVGTAAHSKAHDQSSPFGRKQDDTDELEDEDELAREESPEIRGYARTRRSQKEALNSGKVLDDSQIGAGHSQHHRHPERRVLDRRKATNTEARREAEENGKKADDMREHLPIGDLPEQPNHEEHDSITELWNDNVHDDYLDTGSQYAHIKQIALSRLTQKRAIPLMNLSEERAKVHALLSQTVAAGEGNSMLVIGARGTGKTALVNSILSELTSEHEGTFHVIRLNGFLQTDDKLALREIWRQLGRELDPDEETTKSGGRGSNYADTLAKLLALLSHPDEQLPQSFNTSDVSKHDQTQPTAQDAAVAAKSVVFVMDEFDLFATHPRQTLLYNLFDVAQSKKAPIAILGLTTRIDAAESLEKRVKSRFSHRYVHLPLPRTPELLRSICVAALTIHNDDVQDAGTDKDLSRTWNSSVVDALLDSPAAKAQLERIFATTRSPPDALTSLIIPLFTFEPSHKTRPPYSQSSLLPPHSSLHVLPSLSILQLALLISAARLEIIHSSSGPLSSLAAAGTNGSCNFNAAYQEYVDLVARARLSASSGVSASGTASLGGAVVGGRVWGREVARTAWQALRRAGLLVGGSAAASGNAHVRPDELLRCDVALEEIEDAASSSMPTGLRRWCREI